MSVREFGIALDKMLRRGLRPTVETGQRGEHLVTCHNQMPSELGLRPHETIIEPTISGLPTALQAPFAPDYTFEIGPIPYVFNQLHAPPLIFLPDITTIGVYFGSAVFKWAAFNGPNGGGFDHGNQVLIGNVDLIVGYFDGANYWYESGALNGTVLFIGTNFSPLSTQFAYQLWDTNNMLSNSGLMTLNVLVS